ncbi:lipopolysaccharide transport periplasmic protein LptA [Dissulfurirhabdus thermomarina]|uniref:Lipopolysaccharide transport periplasmic protein LptA n=1 Tax=Dissulfurirhabdus thermomarina TaxID=1765737 RepID=A0A6N9TQK7_DISTH|nr:lipopolysaccharide transport periplasmic protein LptA [Dissulfurirhabdus thermomarina]NDY41727.1 lipopolysaccharide transport periplasmic protein LptA [Dissulfurirhabdus thermomarina]NMX23663.1 lipopolysaccharide transport periplasmic protein LptA [Dissulfurirhabdus thermomarina]
MPRRRLRNRPRRIAAAVPWLLLLAAVFGPYPAGAAARRAGSAPPIRIQSDRMEATEGAGRVLFTGHVVATRGELRIEADRMEVFYSADKSEPGAGGRRIRRILVTGGVRLFQGERTARAREAEYLAGGEERVVLSGNATVTQGQNRIRGQRITVYLDEERSVAEGGPGGRVETLVYPEE